MKESNKLYCIITKSGQDHLESAFEQDCMTYMDGDDGECMVGFDVKDESIYFTFMEEWKIEKMLEFFQGNGILISVVRVKNVINFINSDEKYMKVYSEERNKEILNRYITYNVSVDSILERIFDNKDTDGFSLLPIEQEILSTQ